MPIVLGSRLGPYEITAVIGAGGMGDVYRARDHRLGRDIAVKVLSENIAADPVKSPATSFITPMPAFAPMATRTVSVLSPPPLPDFSSSATGKG